MLSMRSRISRAARFVNVNASSASGRAPCCNSHATREVSTRVLPLPAPAITSTARPGCSTATRWEELSVMFWKLPKTREDRHATRRASRQSGADGAAECRGVPRSNPKYSRLELGADAHVPARLARARQIGVPAGVELEDQEVHCGADAGAEAELEIVEPAPTVQRVREPQLVALVPHEAGVGEHGA